MGSLVTCWSVGVVVPARNEQGSIAACLKSILAAIDACDLNHAWVVLAADRCVDRTVPIARQVLRNRGHVILCNAGSAGAARRVGTDHLLQLAADVPRSSLWLANTDADTVVPRDWIARHLKFAQSGASALAGIVNVESFVGHGAHGAATFARHYAINADGTHPHVHGANLGLRADACVDAGGWTDIRVGEDHCLWRRLKARGWPAVSTAASVVSTSGRLRGRARGGFADTLRRRLQLPPP
jgi:glycosyltransferase involved in cell wall biosynthesis